MHKRSIWDTEVYYIILLKVAVLAKGGGGGGGVKINLQNLVSVA